MSVPFNRFWAPKRNISAHAGIGIKVPSVERKRKSPFVSQHANIRTLYDFYAFLEHTHFLFENIL